MKVIVGGHYTNTPQGWIALSEQEQDMTKRLNWEDNSIDVLYSEHCVEHLPLEGAISYFKESLRVLKGGGVLRTVCPTIDKLIKFGKDDLSKHYSDIQTSHYYPNEDIILKELGLEGVREEPIVFMFDSLFKGHNHRLIWTSQLMKKVLEKIGFSEVYICEPGETNFNKEDCLERIIRGVNPEYVKGEFGIIHYDPESMVIEAKK